MLLIFHVGFALSSIIITFLTFLLPSKPKLQVSKILISLTLVSGTLLVATTHTNMLSACISGLAYTAFTFYGIVTATNKLACIDSTD